MDIIFLLGRILFGGVFLMFGIMHLKDRKGMEVYAKSKGVAAPKLANLTAGLLLVLSGALVMLGIFPDIAMILLIIFLTLVSVIMHDFWTIKDPKEKINQMIHFMLNVALIGASIMLIWLNNWPLSF